MTASRADAGRRAGRLLAAGLLVAAVPAVAVAQPIQLIRPTPQVESPAPPSPEARESEPAPVASPPATAPDAALSPPASETGGTALPLRPLDRNVITVNPLEAIDPDAIGVIGEAENGFATTLWRGTDWSLVSRLMPRMPDRMLSRTIRSLSSRLLLSRASVPAGKPADASFVSLRVERLLAMGDVENALALLKLVPEQRRDEAFARTEIETMFFDNRNADACARVRTVAGSYAGVYWKQAQAFCLALAGEHARAALIADLLREQESEIEPAFFTIIESLGGLKDAKVGELRNPSGLLSAMMRAASLPLPASLRDSESPVVLRNVALAPNAAVEVRLAAAEKAFAAGALTADQLVRLYLSLSFTEDELSSPISRAESNWGPRGRALLIRAAAVQNAPLAKAEVLRRAWQIGREKGGYTQIARASAHIVAGIEPSSDLVWFAQDAGRVLFAAGRIAEAMAWYETVAADRDRLQEARAAEAALWPLALFSGSAADALWQPERLEVWYADLRQTDADEAARRALVLYAMLDATGYTVPDAAWRALLYRPLASAEPGLNVAWSYALGAASMEERTGETVLLTTVGAATGGERAFVSVDAAWRAVLALRRIGLEEDARRLALETVMAAGL